MPPSICARMTSGLTATPQSTAHQTLCTRGPSPSPTDTSAIWATKLSKLSTTATPRARPFDRAGAGQRASSATARSTPAARGALPIIASRPATGSWPAACSSSSTKHSTA